MGSSLMSAIVPTSFGGVVFTIFALLFAYQLSIYIYNIYFHPLSKFPGPKICAASSLPLIRRSFRGDAIFWQIELHQEHGQVVRLTPNELSFSGADAYKDVYGFKKAGRPTLEKDPRFYFSPDTSTRDIINADDVNHARMRKIFSNAFSDRALKLQEPLFLEYVDKLVSKIREGIQQDSQKKFNMVQMYNLTTFDVMGDLTFGEPLNMLDNSAYHPWVAAAMAGFKFGVYVHSIRYYPAFSSFLMKNCIPQSLRDRMKLHDEFCIQRVDRRLEKEEARPDIWGLVLEKDTETGMTKEEMYKNANLFMLAGTETTATLLSGLTWHLLTNPDKMQKLVHEIRISFHQESEITIERLAALKYLNACLEEGLRMYPPVAQALPRLTPPGAPTTISGHQVPANSTVQVSNLCAFRNPKNFLHPTSFIPERWLPDTPEGAAFVGDKKHAFQPFSTGPRACLGKNMAYHEMRIVLTKLLWNFDLELCEESRRWGEQKIFIFWEKGDLWVRVREVRR